MGIKNKSFDYINTDKEHFLPKSEDEWVAYILDAYDEEIARRQPHELQWAINSAYYAGFQSLSLNLRTKQIYREDENNELYIINRIAPYVENLVSKIIQSKPILGVMPDTNEREDVAASELSEMLLKNNWKKLEKDRKAQTLALYTVLWGTGFKKTTWNPNVGNYIEGEKDYGDGSIGFDEKGIEKEKIFMGEIESEVHSPWAVVAAPNAGNDLQKATWVINRLHVPISEARQTYELSDEEVDEIKNHGPQLTVFEQFASKLATATALGPLAERTSSFITKEDSVICVKEYWRKPDPIYPKGVFAVVVGKKLKSFAPWPYTHGLYPFTKFVEKEDPFNFYGISSVTRLIPIQKRYNRGRTQIAKNVELMTNSKFLVPRGSGVGEDALSDEEGEIVEYNPNVTAPSQMAIQPLPNYVVEALREDLADIDATTGTKAPQDVPFKGITASVALQTAAELADQILIPLMRNFEYGYIDEGRQELMLAAEFYKDQRIIKTVGENNEILVKMFRGIDLRHQTDISIKLESGMGLTKAAQQQRLLELWDRRVLQDPQAFMQAFVYGKMDMALKPNDNAKKAALEEVQAIKEGKAPIVLPFHNHIVHMQMLAGFIGSPEFTRMAEDRQQLAQEALKQHIAAMQPQQEASPNPAAVGTPFGAQVTEGQSA